MNSGIRFNFLREFCAHKKLIKSFEGYLKNSILLVIYPHVIIFLLAPLLTAVNFHLSGQLRLSLYFIAFMESHPYQGHLCTSNQCLEHPHKLKV